MVSPDEEVVVNTADLVVLLAAARDDHDAELVLFRPRRSRPAALATPRCRPTSPRPCGSPRTGRTPPLTGALPAGALMPMGSMNLTSIWTRLPGSCFS